MAVNAPPAHNPYSLALLRRWADLLDSAFVVPGTSVRFGLDAVIGLVPGIGDLATPAFTVLLLLTGLRMRVPLVVLVRMALNAGFDALIGIVPIAGDLADIAYKANLRNLQLLERHALPGTPPARSDIWLAVAAGGLVLFVCAMAMIPIAILLWAIWRLSSGA
jgi:hypothetical protein